MTTKAGRRAGQYFKGRMLAAQAADYTHQMSCEPGNIARRLVNITCAEVPHRSETSGVRAPWVSDEHGMTLVQTRM